MSSIEESSTNAWLHRLFLYTTIFIILAGGQYFDEFLLASNVKMVRLNDSFPNFAQMTGPALLMILLANIHTKHQSFQFTVDTRDIILAFAVGAIIFLEILHAYFSGDPMQLEFAYDLFFILLCYSALKSFDFETEYVDKILNVIMITTLAIITIIIIAIIIDFLYTKQIFLEKDCAEMDIYSYLISSCRPIPDAIYKIAQLSPFVIALACWCILKNSGHKTVQIIVIALLIFMVSFSKARLPWMVSLFILACAGLFAIYRWRGLKMASAAVALGLVLVASSAFFFSELFERVLTLNRGLTPDLVTEIRNWDIAQSRYSGMLLRSELFLTGLRQFAESPLIGHGLGATMGDGTHKELLHGIPVIYAVGYGLVGLTALVALFFPRISMDMPGDWLFMKVTVLVAVITMVFLLQHPPFWLAAAALFLHLTREKAV